MKFDLLIQRIRDRESSKYIELEKKLESSRSVFTYYPPFWRLYRYKLRRINFVWYELKFDSDEQPNLPQDKNGVYLFVLRPQDPIFPYYSYILYVGMSNEGLIQRLNNGYRTPSGVKLRPHIHRLINEFGKYLYWYYCPLGDEYSLEEIEEIESLLIGYFCNPPLNKKDQPLEIREADKSKMF